MSAHHHDIPIPSVPLRGAIALVVMTVAVAAAARLGWVGTPKSDVPAAVVTRELRFEDRAGGDIEAIDARTGARVETLHGVKDGFARATLRLLAQERIRRGIGADVPFRLSVRSNGGVVLEDPATGRLLELEAYGSTNAAAFARLLVASGEAAR